ncbi:MAG: LCP family protein [Solirubrobacterales bacterium]|nr:LCP family protein [Solirubrobacterales bacterium]
MRLVPTSRSGALGRFALGGVIVIAFAAATTAVAGLLQFKQFAKDIGATPAIKQARVTIADAGAPQTLLLIGSDHRAGTPFSSANTDTMMLVRIDPSSATINLLSIPRDLPVQLPGRVGTYTAKLNLAYSVGGPNLLVRVLRQQVFPRLEVNHIIDVNFGGFEALVNAIGCVYTDVDHRYYNNTAYELLEHRPPAWLPEAVRGQRAVLRALPPQRQRHRPQRPPAGLPALGQGSVPGLPAGGQP